LSEKECSHDDLEYLGSEKTGTGANKYYKCLNCRSVLVLSDEGIVYMIPPSS